MACISSIDVLLEIFPVLANMFGMIMIYYKVFYLKQCCIDWATWENASYHNDNLSSQWKRDHFCEKFSLQKHS